MLGSGGQPNQTKEYLMLWSIETAITFSEVRLPTTDSKVKVRLNQCSGCAALVQPPSRLKHKKFHDELRTLAKEVGLARR